MKSVIVYYSYSGNTRKAAEALKEHLEKTLEVDIIELKAIDESDSFFKQALGALVRTKAKMQEINTDLSKYDFICIGTPVWAFGPAPAMNTFLSRCKGLEGKDSIVFTTYGSGAGNSHCIIYIKNILHKKGINSCKSFTIAGARINDKAYVQTTINKHN
jgi:flavodoxin